MIENRKNYRLPFRNKFIFGTEDRVETGNATNMSAGGLFVMTLKPFPRDTHCKCLFLIDAEHPPIVTEAIVKRVIATSPNVDDTPGVGLEFVGAQSRDLELIGKFMDDNRRNFELAATLLASGEPDLVSLEPLLEKMHLPRFTDLGELRFYVERILTSIEMVDRTHGKK